MPANVAASIRARLTNIAQQQGDVVDRVFAGATKMMADALGMQPQNRGIQKAASDVFVRSAAPWFNLAGGRIGVKQSHKHLRLKMCFCRSSLR